MEGHTDRDKEKVAEKWKPDGKDRRESNATDLVDLLYAD